MSKNFANPAIVLKLCINGLGVSRCLGHHGVQVIGLSQDQNLPGIYSRFISEIWKYNGQEEDMIELLLQKRDLFDAPPVLYAITDAQVLALVAHLDRLRDHYLIGLPPKPELVIRTISKKGFHKMTDQYKLPAPQTVFIDNPGEIEQIAGKMKYPCIIKPEFRSPAFARVAKQKALCCHESKSLVAFYHSFCQADPRAVIQQWIPGGDEDVFFCLQYYDRSSRPLVSFVGKKIRQWPVLSGGTASCIPVDKQELESLSTAFFTSIGFHGLCSMEYKRNPIDGQFMMIEPTIGRTDWQSDVATINGIPIPYVAYCDLAGVAIPEISRSFRAIKWIRWSADKESAEQYRKQGKLSWWCWLWSIRPPHRWSVWRWNDPKPYLWGLGRKVRKKLRKIFGLGGQARKEPDRNF